MLPLAANPFFGTQLFYWGLVFPTISWLTLFQSVWTGWRKGRSSSVVFIPFVGPILLTWWISIEGHSLWMISVVWVLDIGTMCFIAMMPRMIKESWESSKYTRILTLHGVNGNQDVVIEFQQNGKYALRKTWDKHEGEYGTSSLGEPGTFSIDGDTINMVSHLGQVRTLAKSHEGTFLVEDNILKRPDLHRYCIDKWSLGQK